MRSLCWIDENTGWLPDIGDIADPVALGVHAAVSGGERSTPHYVARDIDDDLDDALRQHGFALIVGHSTSGKSRAAYEAMRRLPAHWTVLVPRDGAALHTLLDDGLDLKDTVVWLDDIERYLGPGGLDPHLLRRLRGDDPTRVVALATMRANEYTARLSDGDSPELMRADQQVLRAARTIHLERSLTPAERRRAQELAADPRILDAVRHAQQFGLGEFLAAGPRLWRRWKQAITDTDPAVRAGAALVSAAVDSRRAGLLRPLTTDELFALLPYYLPAPPTDGNARHAALGWATDTTGTPTGLLLDTPVGIGSFDYLLDEAQRDHDHPPVPTDVWKHLVLRARPADAVHIGMAAYWAGRLDDAELAFRAGLDATAPEIVTRAALGLSEVAHLLDQFDEARRWAQVAARRASTAQTAADPVIQHRDLLARSEQWYRTAAGIDAVDGGRSGPGRLRVEHEHAAMHHTGHGYTQRTYRRLTNASGQTLDRYPIRIAVERYPDDPELSRSHHRRHPLVTADLGIWARCDGRRMTWSVSQDRDDYKEIWLHFADEDGTFAVPPGGHADLEYGYTVSDLQWGPWSQRPIRVPTHRFSAEFTFAEDLRAVVHGTETTLTGRTTALPIAENRVDGRSIFTWETADPPLNSRYRFSWQLRPGTRSVAPSRTITALTDALAEQVRTLAGGLPARQHDTRSDPAGLAALEWSLEQQLLAAVRDLLGPVPVLAEEYHHRYGEAVDRNATSRYRLVLDPLDGSTSYQHGSDTYATTLALWQDGRLVSGIVYQPSTDSLYQALRGQPPTINGAPITALAPTTRTAAVKSTVATHPFVIAARQRLTALGYTTEKVESSALKLCWIAEGRRAGLIKRIAADDELLLEWGVAAGMLICHQAGRHLTDWTGAPWQPRAGGLLAGDDTFLTDLDLSALQ
ncbi:inositol monophosphatase family protein [Catenuloplanes japonicus]|uniref:inositol monophosphatase family protein n=1 Tax=Catenuloplanes japonicus TaxID=33876 RepID=UPI00068A7725|nr:inositol monophosphatase family protein [Catenuloplanes japonicus]